MHLLLFSFSLLFSIVTVPDSSVTEQSQKQAQIYIQNIESGRNTVSNIWALSALRESNGQTLRYIATYLDEQGLEDPIYIAFKDTSLSNTELLEELTFETGSPELLIALLLNTSQKQAQAIITSRFKDQFRLGLKKGIDFESLVNAIVNDGKISPKLLPVNQAPLLHFLFLYEGSSYWSTEYLSAFTQHWNSNRLASNYESLPYSLYKASLVRANFILDLHRENIELYEFLVNDRLLTISSNRLNLYRAAFYSFYQLGYYDKGLTIIRNSILPLADYFQRKDVELNTLMNQAISFYNIGKIEESKKLNLKVQQEAESKSITISQSRLYNNLGIAYWQSGEFNKYLELQFKALEIAEKNKNISHQLSILQNLSLHYTNIKEEESALLYLNKARELALSNEDKKELGNIYISIGIFQRDFNNNFDKALEAFKKAESLLDKTSNYVSYRYLLHEKAILYEHNHNYEQSILHFKLIQELAINKESQASYLEALVDEARIQLLMDKPSLTEKIIKEIQALSLENSSFIQIVKAKTVEANYLSHSEDEEEAYNILRPVIEQVVHRAKASTSVESGFWNIAPEYLEAFDVMVNLLMDTGRQEEAIEVLDKLKTINDPALYQNPMVKSSLLSESELIQYQQLTNELDALRKQQLVSSEDKKTAIRRRIDQLSVLKQSLDQKISQLTTRPDISLDDVQKSLKGSEIVLHITELNDWYYIGRVTKRNTEIDKIRLDSTTRSIFANAITNLSSGNTNLKQLHQISELLKLQDLPQWISTITIVPDSYLFELPIDILPLKKPTEEYSYGETTYMVEKFNTHYVTSINDFITSATSSSTDHEYDFVGYGISSFNKNGNDNLVPLPFAKSEVNNITDNLTSLKNRRAFLDEESSESAFKTSAPKAKILHLATHSQISDQDPLYSTLYMSGQSDSSDTDFPGQIFAYELFELNLDNEMIMLNSCESGSGSYLQGTGIMGISRALRYAGAKSLVLNLWSVNDMMASEFAIKFYEHLNQGKSKTEALQLTKVHFIKEKNANPHFWGPYMLIGEKSPIIEPYKETNFYFAASFMLYFVLFVAFSLFKRQNHPN